MLAALRTVTGLATCVLSFAYLILVLNPIQMLSVLVYPFSPRLFRNINRWCARSIWGLWVIMAERQAGISIRFVGDTPPPRENVLLIANHQTMTDVMVLLSLAWRCGRIGDLKWFVKDKVKYVPGVGWGMKFLDCIFVKRNWASDKDGIQRLFGKFKRHQIPIFLVTFLEGTRATPDKQAAAQAFAQERGLHVPKHTLVPRTKGFAATVLGLRDHLDAVYDITIGYPDRTPTLTDCFANKVDRIEVDVRRFAVDTLPQDEEALSDWVFDRFRVKDERLEAYQADERFAGDATFDPIRAADWFLPEKRRAGGG